MKFANLHAHTSMGSMLDALVSVDQMFDKAKELGMVAAGVTDHGTLAAHFDAHKASKRTGVKLVPGCEAYFVHSYDPVPGDGKRKRNERRKHLLLLAQNEAGYRNLLCATHEAFKRSEISAGRVYPRMGWDILEAHAEGLVCTSACGQGMLAEKIMFGDKEGARGLALRLSRIFPGRFFLEIQPHHLKVPQVDQELINQETIAMARELGLPLVAAVDTHYLLKGMAKYKDMLAAIRWKRSLDEHLRDEGTTIDEFYMKSGEEVHAFLAEHYGREVADEAVGNTVRIATEMCGEPDYLKPAGNHLPVYQAAQEPDYQEFMEWRKAKVPAELDETAAFMRFRCFKRFLTRFADMSPKEQMRRWERVKYEIKILEKNKFSSYMLVVADFINWAKANGILVGVGRGSVGGCLVAHLLGIHGVDPFDYGLMFERFQNAEKKSLPDIDTDFTSAGRDLVEEYVRQKYGHDKCAQVSNINTYTPKNTISDLARSLRIDEQKEGGRNYFQVAAAIKDSIPEKDEKDRKITTLDKALELSPKFRDFAKQYPELMEYAKVFIGLEKEYSTHAAGMVVTDRPLAEFAPLRIDKDGKVAVQLEKNRCEELGLVKMDFLALSTLDVIDEAFRNIRKLGEVGPSQMEDIPLDDPETYAMISKGHTKGVFQLGKTGVASALCRQIKPKDIIDVAIVNALVRPSSKNEDPETHRSEREEFVGRRAGAIPVTYLHPSLSFLKETNGLCIMEEQLMGVAQNVAGWNLNKADGLRKLTKLKEKGAELAAKLEKEFTESAVQTHKMTPELAQEIWTKVVQKFSGYGFNKTLDKDTKVATIKGERRIVECVPGTIVVATTPSGRSELAEVVKLHDHGMVPMWEVEFDDGTTEKCTLDHKWVTRRGRIPLWEILERNEPVFQMDVSGLRHSFSNKKGNVCAQENLFEPSSFGENGFAFDARTPDVVRDESHMYCGGSQTASQFLRTMPESSAGDQKQHQRRIESFRKDAACGIGNSQEDIGAQGCTIEPCRKFGKMEKSASGGVCGNPEKSLGNSQEIEDGNVAGATFGDEGVSQECPTSLRGLFETGGFCEHRTACRCGGGWTVAFFSGSWSRVPWKGTAAGSHAGEGNFAPRRLAIDSHLYGELQTLWRDRFGRQVASFREFGRRISPKRWKQGNLLSRKVVRISYLGQQHGYDLELNHQAHNYTLASGLFTSNSHAVFYSINSYYTAYLKRHHPAAFIAAQMKQESSSNSITSDDEIESARQECRRLGIKILPPDVNRSGTGYDVVDPKTIITGLSAIKGLGEKAAQEIVSKQPYASFTEFLYRTDARVVNKGKIEAMAKAGCFDSFNVPRRFAFEDGKDTRERLKRVVAKRIEDGYSAAAALSEFPMKTGEEWDRRTLLTNETEVLGQCLSGTINEIYGGFFTGINTTPISRLKLLPNRHEIVVEVLVKSAIREFTIRKEGRNKGRKMVKYSVEDIEGTATELTIWPDQYEMAKRRLGDGVPIRAQCQVSDFNGQKTLMLMRFQEIYGEKRNGEKGSWDD
jgi:DNA-directed DNA polymerase III PolC